MAQFVVRRVEEAVKARLQNRARRNGWSLEQEVRNILRTAVTADEFASDAHDSALGPFPEASIQPRRYRVRPNPAPESEALEG